MFGNAPTGLDGIDMQIFKATNPTTGEKYEFDNSVLAGGDWSGTFSHYDGAFTPEQIEKYYYAAKGFLAKEYNFSGEIKAKWIQEIWDNINPGLKLLSHSIKTEEICTLKVNAFLGNQYTVIVYLNPDITPEDGGSLEIWTPNTDDKVRAMALNTPFGFGRPKEYDVELSKAYWPKPGRYVVFDSRLPNIARPLHHKTRMALVFKGTTIGAPKPDETEFTEVE